MWCSQDPPALRASEETAPPWQCLRVRKLQKRTRPRLRTSERSTAVLRWKSVSLRSSSAASARAFSRFSSSFSISRSWRSRSRCSWSFLTFSISRRRSSIRRCSASALKSSTRKPRSTMSRSIFFAHTKRCRGASGSPSCSWCSSRRFASFCASRRFLSRSRLSSRADSGDPPRDRSLRRFPRSRPRDGLGDRERFRSRFRPLRTRGLASRCAASQCLHERQQTRGWRHGRGICAEWPSTPRQGKHTHFQCNWPLKIPARKQTKLCHLHSHLLRSRDPDLDLRPRPSSPRPIAAPQTRIGHPVGHKRRGDDELLSKLSGTVLQGIHGWGRGRRRGHEPRGLPKAMHVVGTSCGLLLEQTSRRRDGE